MTATINNYYSNGKTSKKSTIKMNVINFKDLRFPIFSGSRYR